MLQEIKLPLEHTNNDGNGSNAGHVRIYAWNGSSWTQQGQDIDGEAAGDWILESSVSINDAGDKVASLEPST